MITDKERKMFAVAAMTWLNTIPKDNHDWVEALIAAALDEVQGDLLGALALAKAEYAKDPTGTVGAKDT